MTKNDYRFVDKDPVIDVIRTELQRYGNLSHDQLLRVSYESGVSVSTIRNWLFGDTRRPWSLSTRFVLEALGVRISYVRDDGTTIRQPAMQMIPQAEQEKILKAERLRKANGTRAHDDDPERPRTTKKKRKS